MFIFQSIKRLKWYETLIWSISVVTILISFFMVSESNPYMQIAPQTGQFCGAKRTRSEASGQLNLLI